MANRGPKDPTLRVGRFTKVKDRPPVIYFIGTPCGEFVKIGYTRDLYPRFSGIQTGNPHKLEILFVILGDRELEVELHQSCGVDRVRGEWFRITDRVRAVMEEARKMAIDYDAELTARFDAQIADNKAQLIALCASFVPQEGDRLADYIRR